MRDKNIMAMQQADVSVLFHEFQWQQSSIIITLEDWIHTLLIDQFQNSKTTEIFCVFEIKSSVSGK